MARKLWGDGAGLAAGALAALDPFAVYFETLVLTESAALCLLAWAALALLEGRGRVWAAAIGGALAGACVLTRPGWLLALILLAAAALGWLPALPSGGVRRRWLTGALAAVAFCTVMSPWWVRNWRLFGEFVPLTTAGGQSLYEGNSERATGAPDVPGTVGVLMRGCAGLEEVDRNRMLAAEARRWIRAHPGRFAGLAAVKFARTWSPVPNEPGHRRWYQMTVSALNWTVVLLLAGAAVWRERRSRPREVLWCLLPALAVVIGHILVVGSVRYRLPAWPFLEVLAGAGLVALLRSLRPRPDAAPSPE
jgi:4-amino-4-deoxy-L-arabinose transferase-like glycosyltransferase